MRAHSSSGTRHLDLQNGKDPMWHLARIMQRGRWVWRKSLIGHRIRVLKPIHPIAGAPTRRG